jgi:hypothetical protein
MSSIKEGAWQNFDQVGDLITDTYMPRGTNLELLKP